MIFLRVNVLLQNQHDSWIHDIIITAGPNTVNLCLSLLEVKQISKSDVER